MRCELFALVFTAVLATANTADAETWTCDYSGRWSTTGSANHGRFKWHVTWRGSSTRGWAVTGDYRDRSGRSNLDGRCERKHCVLTQTYKTGKRYTWTGTYTDQNTGRGRGINTFTGTWRANDGSTHGPWSATANCTRRGNGRSEPPAAGPVKGHDVASAWFAGGRFARTGRGYWTEYGARGEPRFRFVETHRDEWSVYLHDRSRSMRIQIDVYRRMIRVGEGSRGWRDLYPITRVSR